MPRFIEDVTAFTEALGPSAAAVVLPLALVNWPDAASRDEFIAALTGSGELSGN